VHRRRTGQRLDNEARPLTLVAAVRLMFIKPLTLFGAGRSPAH
jgi:hypothetical protein